MILYLLYRLGLFIACAVPIRICYATASVIADIYCRLSRRDREAIVANLRVVLGDDAGKRDMNEMARDVFKNFAKYLVDFFRFQKIDARYVKENVKVEGMPNLHKAIAPGKGVIVLSAHIGNWELGGLIFSKIGFPISAVVLTHQNKKINEFFTSQRLKADMKPIEMGASLKACYRVLRGNGLLALLGDRDFSRSGIPMEFFGKKALIPRGPAAFCHRLGSAILPTFVIRQPDDTFTLYIDEPIFATGGGDEEKAIGDLTKRYVRVMESYIRRFPTQWYVFRGIWDDRNGSKDLRPDTII